jgi:hypothetical protein
VHSLGVKEDEVVHQLPVKFLRIKEKVGVKINEFSLNGFVKAFDMGVHLGSARICVVVNEMKFEKSGSKMFLEFRAVVGQNVSHRVWKDLAAKVKELLCCFGGV